MRIWVLDWNSLNVNPLEIHNNRTHWSTTKWAISLYFYAKHINRSESMILWKKKWKKQQQIYDTPLFVNAYKSFIGNHFTSKINVTIFRHWWMMISLCLVYLCFISFKTMLLLQIWEEEYQKKKRINSSLYTHTYILFLNSMEQRTKFKLILWALCFFSYYLHDSVSFSSSFEKKRRRTYRKIAVSL